MRLEVVRALRGLRDLSGVPALVTSLQDGDPTVREEAISALVEIYTERDRTGPVGTLPGDLLRRVRALLGPALHGGRPVGVPRPRRDRCGTRRRASAREAAYAIGILGGGSAIPDLVAALQDPESDVRAAAATALGKVGDGGGGAGAGPAAGRRPPRPSATARCRRSACCGSRRPGRRCGRCSSRTGAASSGRGCWRRWPHRRPRAGRSLPRAARSRTTRSSGAWRSRGWRGSPTPRCSPAFKKDFQREKNADVRLAYNFAIVPLGDRAFLDAIVLALGRRGSPAEHARDYVLELGPGIAPDLYPYLNDRDPGVRGAVCDMLAAARRHERHPPADAAPGRPELEGGRPRQPGDREAPPGGRGGRTRP